MRTTLIAWLGVAAGIVVAFYATVPIALSCFDCSNAPATWQLLAPWLLPAGMLALALKLSGARWIAWLFARFREPK